MRPKDETDRVAQGGGTNTFDVFEQGKLWEERMNGPSGFWWGRGATQTEKEGSLFMEPRFHLLALWVVHGKKCPHCLA